MYCPHCRRDVVPKTKIDVDKAMSGATIALVCILVLSAFFTFGLSLIPVYIIVQGLRSGAFQYCPICFTQLTNPKIGGGGEALHKKEPESNSQPRD